MMAALGDERDPAILLIGDGWPEELCYQLASAGRYVIHAGDSDATLERERVHLSGFGDGCLAAQRIAAEHPDRVESLTLVRAAEPDWDNVRTELLHRSSGGWDAEGDRLAARSIEKGDPTGWFNRLYAAAEAGEVPMPWDRTAPHPLLAQWARERHVSGDGLRAVVVGCGLGADPAYLAGLGYDTVGFDIAEAAIRVARRRFAESTVEYVVADLLDPPRHWLRAFDLVVEIITVQALPDPPRRAAIVNVGRLVGPGGALVVIALRPDASATVVTAPPFPLTREEIEAFATDGLIPVKIEETSAPGQPDDRRWRAEFRRPQPAVTSGPV
jgi:SAM-dependent methyltransferase